MKYWLVKSEPSSWSWQDQIKKAAVPWDGVRNHQAANNLKAMKKGDKVFFYHSVNEKRIMGTVEVVKESYPDPTDAAGKFVCVDFTALEEMKPPVTLADIKADDRFKDLALIRQSRLSVMPIDAASWKALAKMGGIKP